MRRVGSIETTKVKVRLIAATHRDLEKLSAEGQFREDLYYRLNVMKLMLPPLRDRVPTLRLWRKAFLQKTCEKLEKPASRFSEETLKLMASYRWPGNIRELENAIERAVILADSTEINPELLAIDFEQQATLEPVNEAEPEDLSLEDYSRNS